MKARERIVAAAVGAAVGAALGATLVFSIQTGRHTKAADVDRIERAVQDVEAAVREVVERLDNKHGSVSRRRSRIGGMAPRTRAAIGEAEWACAIWVEVTAHDDMERLFIKERDLPAGEPDSPAKVTGLAQGWGYDEPRRPTPDVLIRPPIILP